MKILIVGGFVRDFLLGKESKDMDFVVVGMSQEQFKSLYPESVQIGKDFPVMLDDGYEYAFARKEKTSVQKYTDFNIQSDQSVTLKEDLHRRDLTINTFAMCPETGNIVSVDGAFDDLNNKILRHTSDAFKEDPLRVLRLARFSSKFPDFSIAEETIELCKTLKDDLKYLSKERVRNEMFLSFRNERPSNFFRTLKEVDCLEYWFPEIYNCIGIPAGLIQYHPEGDIFNHLMDSLDHCSVLTKVESTLFSVLCHDLGKSLTKQEDLPRHFGHDKAGLDLVNSFCDRFNIQSQNRKAALMFCEEHMRFTRYKEMQSKKVVDLIVKVSKFPGGVDEFLNAAHSDKTIHEVDYGEFRVQFYEVLEVKLPKEFQNLGKLSAEHLRMFRKKKLNKIR